MFYPSRLIYYPRSNLQEIFFIVRQCKESAKARLCSLEMGTQYCPQSGGYMESVFDFLEASSILDLLEIIFKTIMTALPKKPS